MFEAFYKRLIELQREYQIYLDEEVSRQLDKSVGVYTRLKQWMDAFCDTEHVVDLKVKKEVAKEHIDWRLLLLSLDKEDKDMMRIMKTVVEAMRYIHFSDRYSPQEFFEGIKGPGEEEMALYGKVFMAMVHRS